MIKQTVIFLSQGVYKMKWIGALLFISITTWIGFEWSNKLNKRPAQIRQLKSALQILEAEMLYSQLPLQAAFQSIADQITQPTKSFFESLSKNMELKNSDLLELWDEQVNEYINQSSLGNTEQEILKQFGRTLGQHDFNQQQKHIQLTTTHLDRELEDARENQHRYGKMAKTLGFLGGLFIVLLLI